MSTLMGSPKKNINCRLLQKEKASCMPSLSTWFWVHKKTYQEKKNEYKNPLTIPCWSISFSDASVEKCFTTNYPVTLPGCQAYSHSISSNHMTRQPCWIIIQKTFFWGICMKVKLSSQRRKKAFVLVIQHGRFDATQHYWKILSCKSHIDNIYNNCPK